MRRFLFDVNDWKNITGQFIAITGVAAKGILYRAGFEAGVRITKENKLTKKNLDKIKEILIELNWGLIEIDLKNLSATLENSFEFEAIKKSNEPTCHFLSGFIAGLLTSVLGEEYRAEEINCKSKGDKLCKFILKETEWYERVSSVLEEI